MRAVAALLIVIVPSVTLAADPATKTSPASWDGPLLKPAPREETYAFTKEPTVKKAGPDRYEIAFATQGKCDVAVAIEGPDGRILRHVVYGVLGGNAPEPLKKDSLDQMLVWNGKDDFGKYVERPEQCRVRVSLGLKPSFDKLIGWHPKDTIGPINGLGADPDGVYIYSAAGYWAGIKKYDHDGNYVRTLLPFPADRVKDLKDVPLAPVPAGESVPIREHFGTMRPFHGLNGGADQVLAINGGRLAFISHGHTATKQILRIGTDGSTRGESPLGPVIGPGKQFYGAGEMAISPDGKWLYLTKLRAERYEQYHGAARGTGVQHAVFRMAWDDKGPLDTRTNVFIGEAVKADSDNDHLDFPEGVACDSQGRIYISDFGNNRIQVFTAEGKYLQTIAAKWPRQIQVHQKTGEIYLMSFSPKLEGAALVKFSPLPNAKEVARLVLSKEDLLSGDQAEAFHSTGQPSVSGESSHFINFCLDSWSTPAKVWMVPATSRIMIWADRGAKFELVNDFDQEMRRDGFTPHAFNGSFNNRVAVDPVRGHLYYVNTLSTVMLRCDPDVGKAWDRVTVPDSGWRSMDEFALGLDGLIYMRTPTYLARFNPNKITARKQQDGSKIKANLIIPVEAEVPFDYGEKQSVGYGGREPYLQGVIKLPAQIRGNGFDMGMGVTPNGNVLVICQNYHQKFTGFFPRADVVPFDDNRYRPKMFPGRLWKQSGLIWAWDRSGKLIGEDLIRSMHGDSCGVRGDAQGNIYVGLAAHALAQDGKLLLPFNYENGPGALLKFPPTGGKVFGTWGDPVALEKRPDRPAEFSVGRGNGAQLWTQSLLWSYAGMGTMTISASCCCPQSRFDTDAYGRSFVPESWRYSVGVVDTNGNPVLHIGRYGNLDSGRGPDSPVKVAGDIAFSQCDYVSTVTDRWLYVADTGNWRVVRLKLGYHTEQTVSLAGLK